jgi:hypothetical protein
MDSKTDHNRKHLETFIPKNSDGSEPESWETKHTCFRCYGSYCLKEAKWARVDDLARRIPSCPKCGCKVIIHQPSQKNKSTP